MHANIVEPGLASRRRGFAGCSDFRTFGDGGGKLVAIEADISVPEKCANAVATPLDQLGHFEAFLHFAAIWTGTTWEDSEPEEWDRMNDVNVKGTFFLVKAVARHMVGRHRGSIVLTTSDSVNVAE
jgi:NAD(P)-dependent dehydrogenase (short-subunit alcohol dehydrogenase family)